jgi:hypothetical protein
MRVRAQREFSSFNTIKIGEIILLQYTTFCVDINPSKGRMTLP